MMQDFLATDSMDELVALLKKAKLDERLIELFPPHKRTLADFDAHFQVRAPPGPAVRRQALQSAGLSTLNPRRVSTARDAGAG
jgi:hypothetical protein